MTNQQRIQYLIGIGILIALNVVGGMVYKKWDLTEDRRYTLTEATEDLLRSVDEVIYIDVLLDGELPAGFKRLQRETQEMLREFSNRNGLIHYNITDPQDGSATEISARAQELAKDGIIPTRLRIRDKGEAKEKLIYPYAIFNYGEERIPVNLLENERPGVNNEVVLNTSIALLEYKFANAIQKIRQSLRKNIVFIEGHGELNIQQTAFAERQLRENYNTAHVDLDTIIALPGEIDLIIVAKPREAFSDKELFILDQFLVNGGNAIFMIDPVNVSLDSLTRQGVYIPQAYELNLAPLFFKYGARIEDGLVLDLECTRIPLVVGQLGDRVQTELFPWYYHPLVAPLSEHPIAKNIDRVNLHFPSRVDTIQTKAQVKKTILLESSEYSRFQRIPVRLDFDVVRYEPDPKLFDEGGLPLAVLLEGEQLSLFENRITPEFEAQMRNLGTEFVAQNKPSKILIVADGDLAKNVYNPTSGEIGEMGYNKYENFVFQGNQALFFNTVEYMLDDSGIITARAKEIRLRMLDQVKAEAETSKWQFINVGLPLLVLILGVWLFNWNRKRRFAR